MSAMQGVLLALVVLVIFVNGWTDAPNAIACAVSTRSLSCGGAVRLAAVCNMLGILVMSCANASVANTVTSLVAFGNTPPAHAAAALCACMAAIVLFSVAAWAFGIPTSESHALLAGIMGAGLALGSPLAPGPLWRVLAGLGVSLALGLGLGFALSRALGGLLKRWGEVTLTRLQILAAAGMAFMHGAQDGLKFLAVLVMAERLAVGTYDGVAIRPAAHIPAMLLCAAVMALGTSVGGGRILVTVGRKMVSLQKQEGVCADLGAGLCLLLASLSGVPMSTTHTKTTAMMGAALAHGRQRVDTGVIRGMLLAWGVTFPACGAMGFVLARVFLFLLG